MGQAEQRKQEEKMGEKAMEERNREGEYKKQPKR